VFDDRELSHNASFRTGLGAPAAGAAKEQFDVAAKMIDALAGDLPVPSRLGKDERALEYDLSVGGQARGRPTRL
jgi:hypothetical protein